MPQLLVVPSDRDRARWNIERRLRGEDVGSTDYQGLRRDGTTFYVEISAAILRDPGGGVSGYVCITRDRTEQKLAEMSLRESEERYRVLFDGAIEAIYQSSMDGKDLESQRSLGADARLRLRGRRYRRGRRYAETSLGRS